MSSANKAKSISEITKPLFQIMSGEYSMTYVKTGFSSLDKLIGKLYPKQTCCVASRPGIGATSLLVNIALNVAWSSDIPVYIFSQSLTAEDIVLRVISIKTGIELADIKEYMDGEKTVGEKEKEELMQWTRLIENTNMYFIDSLFNFEEIEDYIRNSIQNACIIFTDNIQSLYKYDDVCARKLKEIARDTSSVLLFTSNISSTPKSRKNGRPQISDLSSGIQRFSDTVLLIHREPYYANNAWYHRSDMDSVKLIPGKGTKEPEVGCFLKLNGNCSFLDFNDVKA